MKRLLMMRCDVKATQSPFSKMLKEQFFVQGPHSQPCAERRRDLILTFCRAYFGNTPEPLTVTIAGKKTYILVSVDDIYVAQKAIDELTHDISTADFMSRFGVSQPGLQRLFAHPSLLSLDSKSLHPNPSNKHMTHLGAAFFVTQLIPGQNLNDVQDIALRIMGEKLTWEHLSAARLIGSATDSAARDVSLLQWASRTMIESTTTAFFGPALLKIEPSLAEVFTRFDDKIWKMLYSVPYPFAKDMLEPKERLHRALATYLQLPKHERQGESWFIRTFEQEARARGISSHDIARCLAMVYWV